MSAEKILDALKKKQYRPVYWLEGEEEFFIDQVVQYAEDQILSESEAGFNLTVFYGRDADWASVINACRRYPMFSERQVVILKEAQSMRDIDKLEGYIDKPLSSTILVVAYKHKKVDGRTRLAKIIKEKGVVLTTKKLYENELPDWTGALVRSKGLSITQRALLLLIDHIGNDLSRLSNEIDKLALNLGKRKEINEDDIEQFVGVSKEFNVFELQHALASRDLYKAIRIVQYFEANPKAGPLQLIFPSLYNFFSKVLMIYTVPSREEKVIAQAIGVHSFFVKDYLQAATRYSFEGVEKIILLLHTYNLRSIGIDDAGTEDALLLKEMIVKIMTD
ncbi:MAG TPA: DNA polymerase III subunit delta [Chitinophagaceae bacterium]|jgi:DNA polymerase-3 subunit delta|nr:DNA polymerase III subunit delta [Chitinophagaceae bacterium]